jgi:hypothetical protein
VKRRRNQKQEERRKEPKRGSNEDIISIGGFKLNFPLRWNPIPYPQEEVEEEEAAAAAAALAIYNVARPGDRLMTNTLNLTASIADPKSLAWNRCVHCTGVFCS